MPITGTVSPMHTYRVRAWAKLAAPPSSRDVREGRGRRLMAELVVKATNGFEAAKVAATDLGLEDYDWNDGSASPPIVLRVDEWYRLPQAERDA